jgi:hypothetical protein
MKKSDQAESPVIESPSSKPDDVEHPTGERQAEINRENDPPA